MAKRITLEDIGKRCGVSAVTVSKALKNQKGVGPQLKEQILAAAEEMGYVKRSRAHNMRVPRTIGVITAQRYISEQESFYWPLYRKLTTRIQERDSVSVLETVDEAAEKEAVLPTIISNRRVDGVVIMGSLRRSYMEALYRLTPHPIPLICLDSEVGPERSDAVVCDNIGGGYEVTKHLLSMGHSRIGFLGTLLATSSIDNRFLGYVTALMEHGIIVKHSWILEDRDHEKGELLTGEQMIHKLFISGDASDRRKDKRQSTMEKLPTAFFCNCDRSAFRLMEAFQGKGIKVPEDISVAGFDNYLPDGLVNEGITTYAIDLDLMVSRAVSRIFKKVENPSSRSGIFVTGGRLILRDSVKRIGEEVPMAERLRL